LAGEVENWPGYVGPGIDLMRTIKAQAERFGAEFLEADVEKVMKDKNGFVLQSGDKQIRGKSLIVALGTEHKQLNIPGEKEFLGKGVSYCATCDGNFFRGKTVVVVGGADSAAKAALYLANICEKVYIVYRKNEMRCEPVVLDKIKGTKNIEIIYNSNPTEVVGENVVKGLRIVSNAPKGVPPAQMASANADKVGKKTLDVDGVFIEVGSTPAIDVVKDLGLKMEKDYIITGKDAKTSVEGVFAAGDVTNSAMRQMITAAGEGAIAAKGAHDFILGK
ncbi:MAG: FAD-dependent oxidoreductase, partial [Nanoarchaeota archaeon]|nr:FAD-dependent oxidoreductase [Nanoarchaeota archaeon]